MLGRHRQRTGIPGRRRRCRRPSRRTRICPRPRPQPRRARRRPACRRDRRRTPPRSRPARRGISRRQPERRPRRWRTPRRRRRMIARRPRRTAPARTRRRRPGAGRRRQRMRARRRQRTRARRRQPSQARRRRRAARARRRPRATARRRRTQASEPGAQGVAGVWPGNMRVSISEYGRTRTHATTLLVRHMFDAFCVKRCTPRRIDCLAPARLRAPAKKRVVTRHSELPRRAGVGGSRSRSIGGPEQERRVAGVPESSGIEMSAPLDGNMDRSHAELYGTDEEPSERTGPLVGFRVLGANPRPHSLGRRSSSCAVPQLLRVPGAL